MKVRKVEESVNPHLVDLSKVSQLPNGDMVQQRPRGYMRPDTVDLGDLGQAPKVGDEAALRHAAEQRGRRETTAQDIVDQAAAAAERKV